MNAAGIVVFPFKKIYNSGSIILCTGFAKPIMMPETYFNVDYKEY